MASGVDIGSPTVLAIKGAVVPVAISVPAWLTADEDERSATGRPQRVLAAIDTGAVQTCVDETLMTLSLEMPPSGFVEAHGMSGRDPRPIFSCTLEFLASANHSPLFLPSALGVDLSELDIQVLLGRGFLRDKLFSYDCVHGEFTLCW